MAKKAGEVTPFMVMEQIVKEMPADWTCQMRCECLLVLTIESTKPTAEEFVQALLMLLNRDIPPMPAFLQALVDTLRPSIIKGH